MSVMRRKPLHDSTECNVFTTVKLIPRKNTVPVNISYQSCGRRGHAALYTVSFSIYSFTTSDLCDVALHMMTLRRRTHWRLTLPVQSDLCGPHDPARGGEGDYSLQSVCVLINSPVWGGRGRRRISMRMFLYIQLRSFIWLTSQSSSLNDISLCVTMNSKTLPAVQPIKLAQQ
jgi:hypothetical protein